jgi:hypothetical protein
MISKITAAIFLSITLVASSSFLFGTYHLHSDENDTTRAYVRSLIFECLLDNRSTDYVLSLYLSSKYMTILEAYNSLGQSSERIQLSHNLNSCIVSKSKAAKEVLLQVSLSVWPANVIAAKNLAFMLEWNGIYGTAKNLYKSVGDLTNDPGILMHEAMCSPHPISMSMVQAHGIFDLIAGQLRSLLLREHDGLQTDALQSLRELPTNVQYLGHPPAELYELLSKAMLKYFPAIEQDHVCNMANSIGRTSGASEIESGKPVKLRLGVVSGSDVA